MDDPGEIKDYDAQFMELAISMAKLCKPKSGMSGTNPDPKVGAVIAVGHRFLTAAHRGEDDHAEKRALDTITSGTDLTQATVYTTLEPCTKDVRRRPGESCTERLIAAGVKKVWIGILDPNQGVVGKGISALQLAGIEVALFPQVFVPAIKDMNQEFIRAQQSLGLVIDSPEGGDKVPPGQLELRGTLVNEPRGDNEVYAIVRKANHWWPQGRLIVKGKSWTANVTLGDEGPHTIYLAKTNELSRSLLHYYYKVGALHRDLRKGKYPDLCIHDYTSIEMDRMPKGLDEEASVEIVVER